MKIYCVLCDGAPMSHEMVSFAMKNSAHLSLQISNSFTLTSVVSLLTGKMPTDLKPHGFGWRTVTKEMVQNKTQLWHDDVIFNKMDDWQLNYHDATWMYQYLYGDEKIKQTSTYPGGLEVENTSAWDSIVHIMLGSGQETESFYQRQKEFIKSVQEKRDNKKNQLYFVMYHGWHSAMNRNLNLDIATEKMANLLPEWDLNEPDSLFIFFSDHGDFRYVDKYSTPPHSWSSWAIIKDNTSGAKKINKKLISIRDLYSLLAEKVGVEYNHIKDIESLYGEQNKERIYFMEDSRQAIDKLKSTTASAIKVLKWTSGGYPEVSLQVSYHKPEKKYTTYVYDIAKNVVQSIGEVDEELKNSLINRFDWISDK